MKNRICLITGGTSGVGKAIATGLACLDFKVIILSKNHGNGASAVEEIQSKTGNDQVSYRVLDLENFDSIHGFTEQFYHEFGALHVLSNNAAVFPVKKEYTTQGIEKIFAVNYLSHFILTYHFLTLLKSSVPSRVITVSGSPSHLKFGTLHFNDNRLNKDFHPLKATLQAAIAKVAFSRELSKKLKNDQVTSNTFHPGLVKTRLPRHFMRILQIPIAFLQLFFSESCETGVYLASSPDVEGVTGQFFNRKSVVENYPWHRIDRYSSSFWEKSKQLAGL